MQHIYIHNLVYQLGRLNLIKACYRKKNLEMAQLAEEDHPLINESYLPTNIDDDLLHHLNVPSNMTRLKQFHSYRFPFSKFSTRTNFFCQL